MAWKYLLSPTFQVVNTAGKPATGGYIEVYIHGTRDRYYCASDFDGTLHPFKIPLDSLGASIVLADDSQTYDVYVYNRYGSLIMSRYDVPTVRGKDSAYSGDVSDATCSLTKYSGDTSEMSSGSALKVLFTKISKFFASLKSVAFTGSYNDLSNKPDLTQYIPSSQKGAANGVGTLGANSLQPFEETYNGYFVENNGGSAKVVKIGRFKGSNELRDSGGASFSVVFRSTNQASGQALLWVQKGEHNKTDSVCRKVVLFNRPNSGGTGDTGTSIQFYKDDVLIDGVSYVDVYMSMHGYATARITPLWMNRDMAQLTFSSESVELPQTAVIIDDSWFVRAPGIGAGDVDTPVYVAPNGVAAPCTMALVASTGSYNDLSDKPSTVFMATYGVASYSDVEDAYFDNEQLVFCTSGNYLYPLKRRYSNKFIFEGTVDKDDGTFETITLDSSNAWTIETHSVDEYCVYRKSYDALHPLSTAATAADISNGYMDVEFDLGNADGFVIGDVGTLVFIGIPNRGGPSGVNFADAFTKIELYAINENDTPWLAAKVKDTSKDDYGDTLAPGDYYMWNRTYSGNGISSLIVKKFRARFYLNMNTAWVPNIATKFYIYFTILL